MKFFLWFFGILAGIILIIVAIFQYNENKHAMSQSIENSLQATFVDPNKNAPPTPVPTPLPVGPINYLSEITNAATNTGTRVKVLSNQGKNFVVEIKWGTTGQDLGMKFLKQLQDRGLLVGFIENSPLDSKPDKRGQIQYTIVYNLSMK